MICKDTILRAMMILFVLLSFVSTPAVADHYVNIETNAGWVGSNYNNAVTDLHMGYADSLIDNNINYYFQLGPAFISDDIEGFSTRFSSKVGADVSISDTFEFYGEVYLLTEKKEPIDDLNIVGKLGLTYRF